MLVKGKEARYSFKRIFLIVPPILENSTISLSDSKVLICSLSIGLGTTVFCSTGKEGGREEGLVAIESVTCLLSTTCVVSFSERLGGGNKIDHANKTRKDKTMGMINRFSIVKPDRNHP
ncbi:MAG: hypothetical protein Q7S13_00995 [Candidatus Omnitrophota bacterium]|nr:hypothetical protein [Candidatus Omnitrophota bacterium]